MKIVLPLCVIRIKSGNEFLATGYGLWLSVDQKMRTGTLMIINFPVLENQFHLSTRNWLPVDNGSNRFFLGKRFDSLNGIVHIGSDSDKILGRIARIGA